MDKLTVYIVKHWETSESSGASPITEKLVEKEGNKGTVVVKLNDGTVCARYRKSEYCLTRPEAEQRVKQLAARKAEALRNRADYIERKYGTKVN